MRNIPKPIAQYMESSRNLWSSSTEETLEAVFQRIEELSRDDSLTEELEFLIARVYREGYEDGWAFGNWLKNG